MATYKDMLAKGYDKNNPKHHIHLLTMLMTCADLCDQIKDWPCVKKVAVRNLSQVLSYDIPLWIFVHVINLESCVHGVLPSGRHGKATRRFPSGDDGSRQSCHTRIANQLFRENSTASV